MYSLPGGPGGVFSRERGGDARRTPKGDQSRATLKETFTAK